MEHISTMAIIESNKVTINHTSEKIFNFLSNLNNFQQLMDPEKISDWESTEEMCKLKIKGMGGLGMKLKSKNANSQIMLESLSEKPFPFELKITIEENGNSCVTQLILDADINPFVKMMVEKPLKNFFDSLADKIQYIAL